MRLSTRLIRYACSFAAAATFCAAAAAQPLGEWAKRAGRDEVIAAIVAPPRRAVLPSRWVVQRTP